MKVVNHRLHDGVASVRFRASPNVGGALKATFVVVHYTGGRGFEQAINTLCGKGPPLVSAHLVIGAGAELAQLVPFNRIAWHAGESSYSPAPGVTYMGMNRHAIGIELDNPGRLQRRGDGWATWFGRPVPLDRVVQARHKHAPASSPVIGWAAFPEVQLAALEGVCRVLVKHYELLDLVGHDDVARGRKIDPGPALDLAGLRARVLGRPADVA